MLVAAGITEPADPEPEYVSISRTNQIALTLQENNGILVVDAPTGTIRHAFTAGTNTVTGIDTATDARIDQTGMITDLPREPDAVDWLDHRYLATANEGDWRGGTRGWSVMDSHTGAVVWDAGNSFERLAVRYGLHSEERAGKKGAEPEGVPPGIHCHSRGRSRAVRDHGGGSEPAGGDRTRRPQRASG